MGDSITEGIVEEYVKSKYRLEWPVRLSLAYAGRLVVTECDLTVLVQMWATTWPLMKSWRESKLTKLP